MPLRREAKMREMPGCKCIATTTGGAKEGRFEIIASKASNPPVEAPIAMTFTFDTVPPYIIIRMLQIFVNTAMEKKEGRANPQAPAHAPNSLK
jgi:hypothetical protein